MEYFLLIMTKPDNIPIAGMLILVAFFTWYSLRMAMRNDKKIKEGRKDEIIEDMRK